jgi:hypothetical protein
MYPLAGFPTGLLQDVTGGRSRQEVVGAMKLFVVAGVAVHVALVPYERNAAITCWALANPSLSSEERVYTPGEPPPTTLSLDWEYGRNFTLMDVVSLQRDLAGADDD